MRQATITILRIVIILIATAVLVFLIRMPLMEGRAANLSVAQVYADPFIIYFYVAALPFFTGLYKSYQLLVYNDDQNIAKIKVVKTIKYCAFIFCALVIAAGLFIRLNHLQNDDPAGFLALCAIAAFAAALVFVIFYKYEKKLKKRTL